MGAPPPARPGCGREGVAYLAVRERVAMPQLYQMSGPGCRLWATSGVFSYARLNAVSKRLTNG